MFWSSESIVNPYTENYRNSEISISYLFFPLCCCFSFSLCQPAADEKWPSLLLFAQHFISGDVSRCLCCCVMWTAARIPKATRSSQIKEFHPAAFYFPLSERLNTALEISQRKKHLSPPFPPHYIRLASSILLQRWFPARAHKTFSLYIYISLFAHCTRERNCESGLCACGVGAPECLTAGIFHRDNGHRYKYSPIRNNRDGTKKSGWPGCWLAAFALWAIEPATCLVTYPHSGYCCRRAHTHTYTHLSHSQFDFVCRCLKELLITSNCLRSPSEITWKPVFAPMLILLNRFYNKLVSKFQIQFNWKLSIYLSNSA